MIVSVLNNHSSPLKIPYSAQHVHLLQYDLLKSIYMHMYSSTMSFLLESINTIAMILAALMAVI